MQAPQETQSQRACSGIAPVHQGQRLHVLRVALPLVADLQHVLFQVLDDVHRGETLPVMLAGQASVQRPQTAQA